MPGASAGPLWERLLDIVFPPRCVGCGRGGALLCTACLAQLRPPEAQVCARCERPLAPAGGEAPGAEPVGICPACRAAPALASASGGELAGLWVALRFEGVAREAIHALKYRGQRRLAEPLGAMLAQAAVDLAPHLARQAALIMPVPLHAGRQRQRGFNQAELLARAGARRLGLPVRADLLARVRATPPQVGLGLAARAANVRGAFALRPGAGTALAGRRVVVVDDVCTTGATLRAAAAPLLAGGAISVWGLTVARPALGTDR